MAEKPQKTEQNKRRSSEAYHIDLVTGSGIIICQLVLIAVFLYLFKSKSEPVSQAVKDGFLIENLKSALERSRQEILEISSVHEETVKRCGKSGEISSNPFVSSGPNQTSEIAVNGSETKSSGSHISSRIQKADESGASSTVDLSGRLISLQSQYAKLSHEHALLKSRELEMLGRLPPSQLFETVRLSPPWTGIVSSDFTRY